MTSHELARKLLEGIDRVIVVPAYETGWTDVREVRTVFGFDYGADGHYQGRYGTGRTIEERETGLEDKGDELTFIVLSPEE